MINHFTDLNYRQEKFDDLVINTHLFELYKSFNTPNGKTPEHTAFSYVWYDLAVNGMPLHKNLEGSVYIHFRNQGEDDTCLLSLKTDISVIANGNNKPAHSLQKFVQFLFEKTRQHIIEYKITDDNNEPFILPVFQYGEEDFEEGLLHVE